jgi:hypothetical protein
MRGLSAKCQEMGFSKNYFIEEKPMDQVHGSVEHAGPDPPWTGGHCRARDLTGAWPSAAPVPESSDQVVGEEEGSTGVPISGSPGLERRRSGGAMTVKAAVEEHSAQARSRCEERGRRGGG